MRCSDSNSKILQILHGSSASGRRTPAYHVHALQQPREIHSPLQTAGRVYIHALPVDDIRTEQWDITGVRESLHRMKGSKKRILKQNYSITDEIEEKDIVIVDDVMTIGQSVSDYKNEIERCGGDNSRHLLWEDGGNPDTLCWMVFV